MIKAADRMKKLLRALLSYSRVSSKAPSFETVDLRSIAEDVIKSIAPAPDGLEPENEIGDLPKINGDPVQMSLLFQNLLSISTGCSFEIIRLFVILLNLIRAAGAYYSLCLINHLS